MAADGRTTAARIGITGDTGREGSAPVPELRVAGRAAMNPGRLPFQTIAFSPSDFSLLSNIHILAEHFASMFSHGMGDTPMRQHTEPGWFSQIAIAAYSTAGWTARDAQDELLSPFPPLSAGHQYQSSRRHV